MIAGLYMSARQAYFPTPPRPQGLKQMRAVSVIECVFRAFIALTYIRWTMIVILKYTYTFLDSIKLWYKLVS